MAIGEYQMIRRREKTRRKWCNTKLKTAKGWSGMNPVREPSRARDTFEWAVEFRDEAVNGSGGKGFSGRRKANRILLEAAGARGTHQTAAAAR
jgi:hypothetical protein